MNKSHTKTYEQTVKFFEEFIRREIVVQFVNDCRNFLGIPSEGMSYTTQDERQYEAVPPYLFTPVSVKSLKGDNGLGFINVCRSFVTQHTGGSETLEMLLRTFIVFNKVIDPPVSFTKDNDDFFKLESLDDELWWYGGQGRKQYEDAFKYFKQTSKKYPVVLYINPEASLNQAKDFLSKNWSKVKGVKKNKSRIPGTLRTKRKLPESDFIYQNRQLSLAQLREKLANELHVFYDEGHIAKIIQLEKKKRS